MGLASFDLDLFCLWRRPCDVRRGRGGGKGKSHMMPPPPGLAPESTVLDAGGTFAQTLFGENVDTTSILVFAIVAGGFAFFAACVVCAMIRRERRGIPLFQPHSHKALTRTRRFVERTQLRFDQLSPTETSESSTPRGDTSEGSTPLSAPSSCSSKPRAETTGSSSAEP